MALVALVIVDLESDGGDEREVDLGDATGEGLHAMDVGVIGAAPVDVVSEKEGGGFVIPGAGFFVDGFVEEEHGPEFGGGFLSLTNDFLAGGCDVDY